jgi:hypothetical protein
LFGRQGAQWLEAQTKLAQALVAGIRDLDASSQEKQQCDMSGQQTALPIPVVPSFVLPNPF